LSCSRLIALKNNIVEYILVDMANIINNTNLDYIGQTIENGKRDKSTLKRPIKLQGEWNLGRSKSYQLMKKVSR
jgi:hypothetical protein